MYPFISFVTQFQCIQIAPANPLTVTIEIISKSHYEIRVPLKSYKQFKTNRFRLARKDRHTN